MQTLEEFFDEVKQRTGSDNQTALALNVERQHVNGWRKGRSKPNGKHMALLSQITGKPVGEILAIINADKAIGEEKEFWENFYKRLGGIAAGLFVAVNLIMTPTPSQAAQILKTEGSILYIMLNRVRQLTESKKALLVLIKQISPFRMAVLRIRQVAA